MLVQDPDNCLSQVIVRLDEYTEHYLVHTGQNYDYELNEIFFHDLDLREPDLNLGVVGSTLAETIEILLLRSIHFRRTKTRCFVSPWRYE